MKVKTAKVTTVKFMLLAGINRPIISSQVSTLTESIRKLGVIRPLVVAHISFITGKKECYIVDGQHLYHGLMALKMDIPYVEIQVKDKQDLVEKIALLNASSKSWQLKDYVTAWASMREDYVTLNKISAVYDLEISDLVSILQGGNGFLGTNSSNAMRALKRGEFKVVNLPLQLQLLDYMKDVMAVLPRVSRHESKYFINEFMTFIRNERKYNHTKFVASFKSKRSNFVLATNERGKLVEAFKSLV